jgi:HPt (histidine-containing phosphotransfer) domain-containing protein
MGTAEIAVDIAHLDRYTGGERATNEEVLRLFETSCGEIVARLDALADDDHWPQLAKQWHDTAHTLKGAARGIGAFALAEAAQDVESRAAGDRRAAIDALQRLKVQAERVHRFIEEFLDGRA